MVSLKLLLSSLAACALGTWATPTPPTPRPLVIWHGLGDSYGSPGMLEFISLIKDMHKGIFVHSIHIEEKLEEDRRAGWFGNANEQGAFVAEQLADIEELQDGFDAIGFSQGGQFLRAYLERYNSPPVHNLITFGSQHMGVSDLPLCSPTDVPCQVARRAARGGVYNEWAQTHLIQAQYFRDPAQLKAYWAFNTFLSDINNEVPANANMTYTDNLLSLSKLVLVLFTEDKTVVPKESSWFGSYAPPEDGIAKTVVPMRLQPLYLENWIGLRTLDERGDVVLETCEGEHMQLSTGCWMAIVKEYVGGPLLALESNRLPDVMRVQ